MEIIGDFSTTVTKALAEIDSKYKDYKALVVCGSHSPHDIDDMLEKIREYRRAGLPFLGICFGHQLAAIEYARNVLGHVYATSEEWNDRFGDKAEYVVKKRPEGLKVGLHEGESYWNNYEVINGLESIWEKKPNFITVQFHPEYQSSKDRPHPILVKFLNYARLAM